MTTRQPDLEDLALFVRVAACGSMGRAAEETGLSQPAVTRRLAALERFLGLRVLERTRRGTTLTPTGRVVVDWAHSLLESAADFTQSVHTLREQHEETLQVAVSMTIAGHVAPTWFARLKVRSPGTEVSMAVRNSAEVADLVHNGGADIGFCETPRITRPLRRRRLEGDRLVLAVAPDHPWANRPEPVAPKELAETPLLVREEGSGTRETLDAALSRHRLTFQPAFVLASNSSLRSAAAAGMGPVVLSELALAPDLALGSLVEVEVAGLNLRRVFTAVWRAQTPLQGGVAELLTVATESCGSTGAKQ